MSSLSFVSLSWSNITDKVSINWQNFTRVRLQLKFAFKIRPLRRIIFTEIIIVPKCIIITKTLPANLLAKRKSSQKKKSNQIKKPYEK